MIRLFVNIQIITEYSKFIAQEHKQSYVIYFFTAPWCPPCGNSKKFLLPPSKKLEHFFSNLNEFAEPFTQNKLFLQSKQMLLVTYLKNKIQDVIKEFDPHKSQKDLLKEITHLIEECCKQEQLSASKVNFLLEKFIESINISLNKDDVMCKETLYKSVTKASENIHQLYKQNFLQKFQDIKFVFVVVDVDQNTDLSRLYGIRSIPAFVTCYIESSDNIVHISSDKGSITVDEDLSNRFLPILSKVFHHINH